MQTVSVKVYESCIVNAVIQNVCSKVYESVTKRDI